MYFLYIKEHNITKLKYFGFTEKANPFKYKGSGSYWKKHLKIKGNDYTTIELWGFDAHKDCSRFAIAFTIQNNIVESEEWANLKGETGTTAGSPSISTRTKIGNANRGRFKGKTYEEIYGIDKGRELKNIDQKQQQVKIILAQKILCLVKIIHQNYELL